MNKAVIIEARKAAEEFIRRAKVVEADPESSKYSYCLYGTPDTAALRRQSMELTRALAQMRK